jgi:uncharacterized MnhB-related membrane protein
LRALLRSLTQWRVSLRWYLIALVLPSALSLFAVYLNVLLGAPAPTAAQVGSWSSLLFTFSLRLVNPFDGPVMAELGWRGYALPWPNRHRCDTIALAAGRGVVSDGDSRRARTRAQFGAICDIPYGT